MIELLYFDETDFDQLIDWVDSPEFLLQWSGTTFTYPLTKEQLHIYIRESNKEHSNQYVYKVKHTKTGEVIGHISLGRIERDHETARIGKVLVSEAARGEGIAVEMIKRVLTIAFDEMKLNRVSLGVFDFNKAAIKCYEKAGFQREGLLRQNRKINNEYWNLIEMSILRSEWDEQ